MNAPAVVAFLCFAAAVAAAAAGVGDISLAGSLRPSQEWLSPNSTFALGFFPLAADSYALGIWFVAAQLPLSVVWVADRQQGVGENASLSFDGGNLVLSDGGITVWETGTSQAGVVGAQLRESGNLVLLSNTSAVVWQSFDHPTHTLLPGQVLKRKVFLSSWSSAETNSSAGYGDPTPGSYSAGLKYGTFLLVWNLTVPFWSTDKALTPNAYLNATRRSKLHVDTASLDSEGTLVFLDKNMREVFSLQSDDAGSNGKDVVMRRLTLDVDGDLRMYSWVAGTGSWKVVWEALMDPCRVFGACGMNGLCNSSGSAVSCSCPRGLEAHPYSKDLPCQSRYPLGTCGTTQNTITSVMNAQFLTSGAYSMFSTPSQLLCLNSCLSSCTCLAAMYSLVEQTCLLYESVYLASADSSSSSGIFFKVNKLEESYASSPSPLLPPSPGVGVPSGAGGSGRSSRSTAKVAGIAVGSSAAVGLAILALTCWCCCKKRKRKVVNPELKLAIPVSNSVGTSVQGAVVAAKPWTYRELRRATKSFDQPLGDGRFGPLFKGVLPDGTVVAVRILRKPRPVDPEGEAQLSEVRELQNNEILSSGMRPPRYSVEATGSHHADSGPILALKRSEDEKVLLPREIIRSSSQDAASTSLTPPKPPCVKPPGWRSRSLGLARHISESMGFAFVTPSFGSSNMRGTATGDVPTSEGGSTGFSSAIRKSSTKGLGFGSFFTTIPDDSRQSVHQSQSQRARFAASGERSQASNKTSPHSGELPLSQELGLGAILSRTTSTKLAPDSILFESTVFHPEEEQQFRAQVEQLGQVNHVNLMHLVGFCVERRRRLLVYNFVENGSIAKFLFQRKTYNLMDWPTRFDVALGSAKGIAYLHDQCRPSIIHCDIRPESIVVDAQFKARVTDFGLVQLILQGDRERIISYMQGKHPYLAPEWAAGLPITSKVDVYSFGLVLLEIVSGRRSFDPSSGMEKWNFPAWAFQQMEASNFAVLADVTMGGTFDEEQLTRVVRTAFWCLQDEAEMRPSMTVVVLMLEGSARIPLPVPPPRLIHGLSIESVPSNITTDKKKLVSLESDGEDVLEDDDHPL